MDTPGARLRAAMERKGWTVTRLAQELGISQPNVSAILEGERPGLKHYAELTRLLGVPTEWVTTGEPLQHWEPRARWPTFGHMLEELLIRKGGNDEETLGLASLDEVIDYTSNHRSPTNDQAKAWSIKLPLADGLERSRYAWLSRHPLPEKDEQKNGPYERIRFLIRFNDSNEKDLAKALNISELELKSAIVNKTGLKDFWNKIAEYYDSSVDWIIDGKGPGPSESAMDLQNVSDSQAMYHPGPTALFPVAGPTIAPAARPLFEHGRPGQLPMLGTVSAGPGDVSFINNPRRFSWPKEVAVYQVIGNSAYPVAFDGQFILTKPHRKVNDQNLVVIETSEPDGKGGEIMKAYLKRYCMDPRAPDGFILASVNIGYNSLIIPKDQINAMIPVIGVLFEEDIEKELS